MVNRDIINRILVILDDYQEGRMRPAEVERSVQSLMETLEALPYERIKDADDLCHRLMNADLSAGDEEFGQVEDVDKVLADFRTFLSTLPDGAG